MAQGRRNAKAFQKGNPGGPGNPFGPSMQKFRGVMLRCVTEDDFKQVVKQLIQKAKEGEPWAIREFLDRTCAKALQPVSDAEGGTVTQRVIQVVLEPEKEP